MLRRVRCKIKKETPSANAQDIANAYERFDLTSYNNRDGFSISCPYNTVQKTVVICVT